LRTQKKAKESGNQIEILILLFEAWVEQTTPAVVELLSGRTLASLDLKSKSPRDVPALVTAVLAACEPVGKLDAVSNAISRVPLSLDTIFVNKRLGKRNVPVGGIRYYGANSAVFAATMSDPAKHCHYTALQGTVTVKVIYNVENVATEDIAESFEADFALTSDRERLPFHPNIVRSFGHFVGTASQATLGASWDADPEFVRESSLFVVMESMTTSLKTVMGKRLAEKKVAPFFSDKEIALTILQIVRAAHHLQKHNIVHRDLKPDNVLLVADDLTGSMFDVKLADFGESLDCVEMEMENFIMKFPKPPTSKGAALTLISLTLWFSKRDACLAPTGLQCTQLIRDGRHMYNI
jgi:hypothetical protein